MCFLKLSNLLTEGENLLIAIIGAHPEQSLGIRRTKTFTWLASEASKQNLGLYFVQPKNVVIQNGVPQDIMGYSVTEEGCWKSVVLPIIQPVWIDFMYLKELEKQRFQYRKLKNAIQQSGALFLNSLPLRKDNVYRILSGTNLGPGCVPSTKTVKITKDVHSFLEQSRVGWLKPVAGSGARNIIRIEKQDAKKYLIRSDFLKGKRIVKTLTQTGLTRFIGQQLKNREYLIQEEVKLPQFSDGRCLDFRVTVQRDNHGRWVVTSTTLRRSRRGALVTNYHAGGSIRSMSSPASVDWLESAKLTIKDRERAEMVSLLAARALQKVYPDLAYLGVDVAPTETCCYIYDCNSRPGRDILTDAEVYLMMKRLTGFISFSVKSNAFGRT